MQQTLPASREDKADYIPSDGGEIDLIDLLLVFARNWRWLLGAPVAAAAVAVAIASLVPPTYTATAVVLAPMGQQGAMSAVMQSLGGLANLAGAGMNLKTPADQYVALLKSTRVADRIISAFGLDRVYDKKYRQDTRKELSNRVRISAGRKDDLITIQVDDHDPKRAAAIANRFIEEFRALLTDLAITEAQQRRRFFEERLAEARDRLAEAQKALQMSGINEGALRAEPKAAAETYASLRAQVTAAEVRLQAMRGYLTEQAPAVQQALTELTALRQQLRRVENASGPAKVGDYIERYRDFKYYETLFELFARQYELARADESRDGLLVQVVDQAQVPEKKSKPRRLIIAIVTAVSVFLLSMVGVLMREAYRRALEDPEKARKVAELLQSIRK